MAQIRNARDVCMRSKRIDIMPFGSGFKAYSHFSGNTYYIATRRNEQGEVVGGACSCPWGHYRSWSDMRSGCKHVQATFRFIENQRGRTIMAHADLESARRERRPRLEIGDGVILTSRKFGT